jgi:hypothetical protein
VLRPLLAAVSVALKKRQDAVPDEEEAASAVLDALDVDARNPALEFGGAPYPPPEPETRFLESLTAL